MIRLAVTMGDPGGIGPEIALKAVYCSKWPATARFIMVGRRTIWREYAKKLKLPPPADCENITETGHSRISIWDPADGSAPADWQPGQTGKTEGWASLFWVRAAAAGCLARVFDGLVTGPICKASINAAGMKFAGHTEYLARLAGCQNVEMMLIGGPLRVVLATRHLALAKVAAALNRPQLTKTIQTASLAVKWLGRPQKSIGVCALNPHAGDAGLLGNEERRIIAPAIRTLQNRGLKIEGPIPADVIFHQALQNRFGAVVAMYHDQGLGPLKMIAFESGVNLTLGLPFVRTSPDHGTAFDIAGKGLASPASMAAAIKLAIQLTGRPNPWER